MLSHWTPKRFSIHNSGETGPNNSEKTKKKEESPWKSHSFFGMRTASVVLFAGALGLAVFSSPLEDSGPRYVSDVRKGVVLGEENALFEGGAVLAEEDEVDGITKKETTLPSGERYRLGHISVGGDTEMYFPSKEIRPLEIFNISYQVMKEDEGEKTNMLIEWETNKLSRGSVLYRKYSENDFRAREETGFNIEHAVLLENLNPETTYVFSITSEDRWGQEEESERYAMYSGDRAASLFDLLEEAFGEAFGWAMRR